MTTRETPEEEPMSEGVAATREQKLIEALVRAARDVAGDWEAGHILRPNHHKNLKAALAALASLSPDSMEKNETPDAWLIYYDDRDVPPEIFMGEGAEAAACRRYQMRNGSWNCTLFRSISPDPMETPPMDETAWLIEMPQSGVPHYYGKGEEGLDWTNDANLALRFARKQDAQAVIDDYGWTEVSAVEHMWCAPRANAPAPSLPKPEADELVKRLRRGVQPEWGGKGLFPSDASGAMNNAAARILALHAELASVRERTIEEIRRRLDNKFGMYLQLGIRDELDRALAKPAEKEKGG